jgi:Transposase DDE domain
MTSPDLSLLAPGLERREPGLWFARQQATVSYPANVALVHFLCRGTVECRSLSWSWPPMPHKHNADRRHHIPKMAFKVENWPEYEAGLRRRGSLTLWIEDAALDHWQTFGPGGQARYKDAAIQTTLMVRTAFRLALRRTEGLMASVIMLMDLTISAPDHSTISRRAVTLPVIQPDSVPHGPLHLLIDSTGLQVYGAGQWLEAKHGAKSRRKWRKLHLAVDADNGRIVAWTLTDQDADDPSQVAPLLDQIDGLINRVTADGAYDGAPTYGTIAAHRDDIVVVIPPRSAAVLSGGQGPFAQRDRHLEMITERGLLAWQKATDYGKRSLVETTMGRYKALIGPRLRARGFAAQQTEAAIGVAVLNQMLAAGHPKSVRRQRMIA